jgi:hypothetical protein
LGEVDLQLALFGVCGEDLDGLVTDGEALLELAN